MKGSRLLGLVAQLRTPLLWVAGVVIVFTVVFGNLPGEGRYSGVLQDSCHAPAFGALSVIMLTLLTRRAARREPTPADTNIRTLLAQCVITVLTMCLLGAGTELLQGMVGRDAELDDAISDVVGSLAACGVWTLLSLRGTGGAARVVRLVALLVCAGTFAYWVTPLAQCASAYWHRDSQFPVLARFRSPQDLYFADGAGLDDRIVAVPPELAHAQPDTALRVRLDSGRWPGITFFEPVPDWRGYHTLALELSNPGAAPLSLHLRVHDRDHDGKFDDRFNTILTLPAHARQTFTIPLARIANSPHARPMDMRRIAQLIVFHDGGAPGEAFLVHRIALE